MNKKKKRTIFVKTPHVTYEESPPPIAREVASSRSAINLINHERKFETSASYKQIEKLRKDLIKFEKLDLKEINANIGLVNKNFMFSQNSRIVIRPKILNNFWNSEKIKYLQGRKESLANLEKSINRLSTQNKYIQKERASKFFLTPPKKKADLHAGLFLEKLKKRFNSKLMI